MKIYRMSMLYYEKCQILKRVADLVLFEKGEPTNYCINGIEIPKECGKAEKYKATIILYDNEKSEREEVE